MEKQDIKTGIRETMSVVFELPEEQISEDSSTDNVESWDSLRHLNLILALEEHFNVSIPDEEVGNMVNFKIIEHVIFETLSNG
jgi:acyl carrier protein